MAKYKVRVVATQTITTTSSPFYMIVDYQSDNVLMGEEINLDTDDEYEALEMADWQDSDEESSVEAVVVQKIEEGEILTEKFLLTYSAPSTVVQVEVPIDATQKQIMEAGEKALEEMVGEAKASYYGKSPYCRKVEDY